VSVSLQNDLKPLCRQVKHTVGEIYRENKKDPFISFTPGPLWIKKYREFTASGNP